MVLDTDFDFDGRDFKRVEEVPMEFWRWPNFKPDELACKGTGKLLIDEVALDTLQALRDMLGRPLVINSAYRSPKHNKAVGGAKFSQHLRARAFDVSMSGHDPVEFVRAAKAVGFGGIGYYPPKNGAYNFIHVDTGRPRTWGDPWTVNAPSKSARPKQKAKPPRPRRKLKS